MPKLSIMLDVYFGPVCLHFINSSYACCFDHTYDVRIGSL